VTETEIVIRLALATLAGLILGIDRELRGISAGMRTHGLVGLSSAAITISALMLAGELHAAGAGPNIDPLRVIQGLAQAIGFIAAGAIFVAKGSVHNLTSAANLWLAAAMGIAAGAGQFILLVTTMILGVVVVTLVRLVEHYIPNGKEIAGDD